MDFTLLLLQDKMFHVLHVHKLTIKLIVIMLLMQLAVNQDLVQLADLVLHVHLILLPVMEKLLTNV